MEKVNIEIRKLGAIRDSNVTISPMMVFSGESGLGKSYVAFLVHFLYRIVLEDNRLGGFFSKKGWEFESMPAEMRPNGLSFAIKELEEWLSSESIEYLKQVVGNKDLIADISIKLPKYKRGVIHCSYRKDEFLAAEKEVTSLLFEMDKHSFRVREGVRKLGVLPWSFLLEDLLKEVLFQDDNLEQTFTMVPGRGALLNVDSKSKDLIKNDAGMYSEFLNDWMVVKDFYNDGEGDTELSLWLRAINGGAIVKKEESVYLQIDDNQILPISSVASSTKELAPLALLFEKYKANKLSILFEEPEAHLHPDKQIAIADFVVGAVTRGAHMQITTHSDYFIRRVNDRIMLYLIRKNSPKLFNELCRKNRIDSTITLDPSMVTAYILKRRDDGAVTIISQSMDEGIPYESFHDVLIKDFSTSMEINRIFRQIRDAK